jgi:peroxiredoxin
MKKAAVYSLIAVFFFSGIVFAAGSTDAAQVSDANAVPERLQALGFQVWRPDTAAPNFTLRDLQGRDVSLEDLKGQVVFLNFWATWCPPCRNEMPSMEKLYRRMEGRNFAMLAVDLQESEEQVRRFVDTAGYSFPVLLDSSGRTGAAYQVSGIPTTYIIDKQGNVLARVVGGREWHTPEIIELFLDLAE